MPEILIIIQFDSDPAVMYLAHSNATPDVTVYKADIFIAYRYNGGLNTHPVVRDLQCNI
jgi:hypothetical protein